MGGGVRGGMRRWEEVSEEVSEEVCGGEPCNNFKFYTYPSPICRATPLKFKILVSS